MNTLCMNRCFKSLNSFIKLAQSSNWCNQQWIRLLGEIRDGTYDSDFISTCNACKMKIVFFNIFVNGMQKTHRNSLNFIP